MPLRFADLFCGIGSFHVALRNLGGECVFACDNNAQVQDAYNAIYGMRPAGDIATQPDNILEGVDVVTAGFPCQPFSRAGFGKGFEDANRGNMFAEICRIVRGSFSKADLPLLILENVSGLLTHDDGRTFSTIITMLTDLGYENVSHAVLLCSDFGIPQNRKRLFIVAQMKPSPPIGESVGIYKVPSPTLSEFLGVPLFKKVANTIRCGGIGSPIDDRHCWDSYWKVDDNGDKTEPYRLTLGDMMKLQGFPPNTLDGVSKSASSKMAGNSIPTVMTAAVCRAALRRRVVRRVHRPAPVVEIDS